MEKYNLFKDISTGLFSRVRELLESDGIVLPSPSMDYFISGGANYSKNYRVIPYSEIKDTPLDNLTLRIKVISVDGNLFDYGAHHPEFVGEKCEEEIFNLLEEQGERLIDLSGHRRSRLFSNDFVSLYTESGETCPVLDITLECEYQEDRLTSKIEIWFDFVTI